MGSARMKLIDAELQQTTGFPIAKGRLWVGSEAAAAALGIGAHRHLLLSSYQYGTVIRPVISITRDPYGFCDATTCDVGLVFYSLSLKDIVKLAGIKTEPFRRDFSMRRRSVMCAGARAGDLIADELCGDRRIYWSRGPIQLYELSAERVADGLHVVISGQVAHGESEHEFSVDATLPWETLALKGF